MAIRLTTAYLETPIGRARQLILEGRLDGEGFALLDPNTCSLDAFGDVAACTELVVVRIPVTFRPVPLEKGETRSLYEVHGQLHPQLRLVIPPSAGQPCRLLVLDKEGKVVRTVTLEVC